MTLGEALRWAVLVVAAFPFIYYLVSLYCIEKFFSQRKPAPAGFAPAVSILKPVRGLDLAAYENFASFCRQDYPEFEVLFCVGGREDPVVPVLEKLAKDFPNCGIRVFYGSNHSGTNDKVAKLARLANEARYDILILSDSDIRVPPGYLRTVVAPLEDPSVGAVTCLYLHMDEKTFADDLQTIGQVSDFYAGLVVARQLDGVKFALGSTIVTRKQTLAASGGFEVIENRPADDLLVGRHIAEAGYRVELLPYTVRAVADFETLGGFLAKRMRWSVVQRKMRPWGHLGFSLTLGLPWSLAAIAVHPTAAVACIYLGMYAGLRLAMTSLIAVWGLKQPSLLRKFWLVPIWDALAAVLWILSFLRNKVRWRDGEYYIRNGILTPVSAPPGNR